MPAVSLGEGTAPKILVLLQLQYSTYIQKSSAQTQTTMHYPYLRHDKYQKDTHLLIKFAHILQDLLYMLGIRAGRSPLANDPASGQAAAWYQQSSYHLGHTAMRCEPDKSYTRILLMHVRLPILIGHIR